MRLDYASTWLANDRNPLWVACPLSLLPLPYLAAYLALTSVVFFT